MDIKQKLQVKLIYFAKKHLGKPYTYGAKLSDAPKTFDCSSLVQYLYQRIGINLPRTALEQAHEGRLVNHLKVDLTPGDLLFIKGDWGIMIQFSQRELGM